MPRPAAVVILLTGLALAGCASTPADSIPPAERAMLEAEAKAGMAGGPGRPVSVDTMLADVRAQRTATVEEVAFDAGATAPRAGALLRLAESRPVGAAVSRIAVGGSSGLSPIDGAALALRRGRALAEALAEPGATLAFDPKLPADTARIEWLTGATGGG